MAANAPPKPNTQAVSWFYGEHQKGTLDLAPKYQRNPIWSMGQKCFLIDSLISGCPIPQVFVNITTEGSGTARKTVYEIVDGQQRLRAILEFMDDEWPLIKTTAKSYPVSEVYKPHINKRFSELPNAIQESIWNYPLAVQELRGWDAVDIRSLFRRLNYVNERLSRQELRHSQFFGEFNDAVEKLAKLDFWDDIGLFSRRDGQRMKDIEFIAELFVIVLDGVQDQQKTLDIFYADYDVVFPKRAAHERKFKQVLQSLRSITSLLTNTRFRKKADFYGLFAATLHLNRSAQSAVDLAPATQSLRNLANAIERPSQRLTASAREYHSTVIEGPNKLPKRKLRAQILYGILEKDTSSEP